MKLFPALAFACLALANEPARAQEAVVAAAADVLAGIEGGGSGYAAGVRRTRTTLRLGAEGWVDEYPTHALGAAVLVEVEPRASVGADLRYIAHVGESFVLHAGATAIIAPEHMIGATFGAAYRLDLTEALDLQFGANGNAYFIGDDLADDTVLWQAMLAAGVRVEL